MGSLVAFVVAVAVIAFAYVGYPLLAWLRAWRHPRPVRTAPIRPRVSVIIAAWREADNIGRKLATLARQTYPAARVEVVLACDGSDDDTAVAARRAAVRLGVGLRVLERPHRGKAATLNDAVTAARGEVLVFTDARQQLSRNAIEALVENLADPEVGAVGGALELRGDAPVSAYWRYEAALRRWEASAGSTVGVSGALYALRRELWRPLPPGTILDDVLVPMRVRLQRRRVVLEPLARAYDDSASSAREFRRKVRTLSGNFQLLLMEPALLSPRRNPDWFNLCAHKLLRLLVPYALVVALVSAALLPPPWSTLLCGAQLLGYGLALAAHLGRLAEWRLARWCETLVVLNLAAVVGAWQFLRRGRRLEW